MNLHTPERGADETQAAYKLRRSLSRAAVKAMTLRGPSLREDFKKIVKDVRAKSFKPVYLLHGEEAFFIDRVAEEGQVVTICALPLYHIFGFNTNMMLSMRMGGCNILDRKSVV